MKNRSILLWMSAAAVMQSLAPLRIPLLSAVLIRIALTADHRRTLCAALLAGLCFAALSPVPAAVSLLYFAAIAEGLHRIRGEVFADQTITYVILGGLAGLFQTLLFALLLGLPGLRPVEPGVLAMRFLSTALSGALTAALLFRVFRRVQHRPFFKRSKEAF